MLSANVDALTCSFYVHTPFTSSNCLIALVETSQMILKKNGENGHPYLVSDFNGMLFSPSITTLTVGLIIYFVVICALCP